jgi:hypothetical protein
MCSWPESLIRESQPPDEILGTHRFKSGSGRGTVTTSRLSIQPTTIVLACADNGLGVQKPAAARIGSGRVRGTPGRSGVSAGLRAVNNAAEGTALAEFACC